MKWTRSVISITTLVSVILLSGPVRFRTHAASENMVPSACSDCNLRDPQGKKVGLWVEGNGIREVYYKDDVRHGLLRAYNPANGKLSGFGEYKHGSKAGTWYYFGEHSHLILIEREITKNPGLTVTRDDGQKVMPAFRSYVVEYYHNGEIKEEGTALYNEDVEIFFFKKGTWKYYDQSGKLIKTEDHK